MSHLKWGGAFTGISLSAGFAIAWMLSGRIVGPLRQLQCDALAIAGGDLSHRSAVKSDDEVGNLADAFNCMAESIEHRQFELQESRNTLAAVIDASPVGIVCSDLDRRIALWNRAAEKLYGYTAAEAIGTSVQIVPPEGEAESLEMYQRARSGETIRNKEVLRLRKDGSLVHVKVAAAPMHSPEGEIRGVAWAHQDITERRKAEAQLERLAHYDPLTGLTIGYRCKRFWAGCSPAMARSGRYRWPCSTSTSRRRKTATRFRCSGSAATSLFWLFRSAAIRASSARSSTRCLIASRKL
jgi:PAS domain S-box-containing protein